MANVLGDLFKDIANAIREKSGETSSMKPAEFPEKILEIEGGGDTAVSDYNLKLAYAMMTRDAKPLSGDSTILELKGFKTPDGGILGSMNEYSFAGFTKLEKFTFSDVVSVYNNALLGNSALKIIDATASTGLAVFGFLSGALNGCTALESVIVRDGGAGINSVIFQSGSTTGSNSTFYVYVPSAYYDTIVANISSDADVPASRYRKLEDYPAIDKWNEKYTVNFWDGNTLVNTVTLRHGDSSSYTYAKSGYKFVQWNPAPTNVTEDMDCYGRWTPADLNDVSWSEINALASEGLMSKLYSVGDEKNIELTYSDGTTEIVTMVLEAFDNGYMEDKTQAKTAFLSKNALAVARQFASSKRYLSFGSSELGVWLNGELLSSMPAELQEVVKGKRLLSNDAVHYKIWLPSQTELQVTTDLTSATADNNGARQISTPMPRFTTNLARIKTLGAEGEAIRYWTRSYNSSTSSYAVTIDESGAGIYTTYSGYCDPTYTYGVVFGFCI